MHTNPRTHPKHAPTLPPPTHFNCVLQSNWQTIYCRAEIEFTPFVTKQSVNLLNKRPLFVYTPMYDIRVFDIRIENLSFPILRSVCVCEFLEQNALPRAFDIDCRCTWLNLLHFCRQLVFVHKLRFMFASIYILRDEHEENSFMDFIDWIGIEGEWDCRFVITERALQLNEILKILQIIFRI